MTCMETYYRLIQHNTKGQLVKDSGLIPSHSYVLQFLEYLEGFFAKREKYAKDVDGISSVIVDARSGQDTCEQQGRVDAGVGVDSYGIVVGTNAGATPEANDNYKLDTKILHSSTGEAGKLNYQAVTFVDPRVVVDNVDFDISRAFLNETGSTITVKEIGIIAQNSKDGKYHLLLRDVVPDEDVPDGYTLTVVYTLRTTA